MGIQTIHDTGNTYNIPSKYDGGVYQVATRDCVVGGVGDQFTLQYTGSSLSVSFLSGSEAVIGGSFFKVTSNTTITLAANSTIYLCASIDLTQPNGSRGLFTQRTSANMRTDNINGSGSARDMLLYIVTTNSSGVSNVVDSRNIVQDNKDYSTSSVIVQTTAPDSANTSGSYKFVYLNSEPATKYDGYIYFIKG